MGLADLHIHSIYSPDCTTSIIDILTYSKQVGLDVIAITDRNEITGSLKAADLSERIGIQVIPGIEITTKEGNLLALFVRKAITPGLSLIETLIKVGEQGGICIAPHLMANRFGIKSLSLSGLSIIKALHDPDAMKFMSGIETYNATIANQESNRYAHILANRAKLAHIGSSASHILSTIGWGYTEFPGYTIENLVVAILNKTTRAHKRTSPTQPVGNAFTHLIRMIP